ncbi:MucR family transcriptional regulator [Falsochrobactrum shanghaiense]|uniref:MucR family transcriptional regulator n=1 Tax=Falsochrobactrum shanghaiense TaxID=2201899 RepID=A0A316J8U0_9HYPH|nr:MucR family transcriptional regulator [Falsochrobactrum shanghaiense]PWL18367.1 MucR family transcriptional regulator [Falsochrobactrum shanghaiense]
MPDTINEKTLLLELTAEIVTAYVTNNPIQAAELPNLMQQVHDKFTALGAEAAPEQPKVELVPAVNPKKSIHSDHLICLEDGLKFKSLKRHLMTHHNLTPEEYRAKWDLPADYPMVAPGYSAARSQLAKAMGLGRKPREAEAEAEVAKAPRKARSK